MPTNNRPDHMGAEALTAAAERATQPLDPVAAAERANARIAAARAAELGASPIAQKP